MFINCNNYNDVITKAVKNCVSSFMIGRKFYISSNDADYTICYIMPDDVELRYRNSEEGSMVHYAYCKDTRRRRVTIATVKESDFITMVKGYDTFAIEGLFAPKSRTSEYHKYFKYDRLAIKYAFDLNASEYWMGAEPAKVDVNTFKDKVFDAIRLLKFAVQIIRDGRISDFKCCAELWENLNKDVKTIDAGTFVEKYKAMHMDAYYELVDACTDKEVNTEVTTETTTKKPKEKVKVEIETPIFEEVAEPQDEPQTIYESDSESESEYNCDGSDDIFDDLEYDSDESTETTTSKSKRKSRKKKK